MLISVIKMSRYETCAGLISQCCYNAQLKFDILFWYC